jgi:hypothetical protein
MTGELAEGLAELRRPVSHKADWAASFGGWFRAWGLPSLMLILAVFTDPTPRALIWSGVLVWMGTACLINARRCHRTHCRYTGPYYFLLVPPVMLHGLDVVSLGPWAWWALGGLILFGSKIIWFGTERLWGRYITG